ncbi:MAG: restriction endonuclease [Deltaproteobacteria bacterium]|nr:restriction endonuclease [Deltaproteobacteria bacterium]
MQELRNGIKSLSPIDVEKLIGEILCQYFQCDVRHVGRSHDRGIDLVMVKSDHDIAVQIKHRMKSDRVEGVALVRDFVGAMVGERYSEGIYITTAKDFSTPAREYVESVSRNFAPLNLINIQGFRELIGNLASNVSEAFDRTWNHYEEMSRYAPKRKA